MWCVVGLTPVPFAPVYCATKHAVVGFTKSWAVSNIFWYHSGSSEILLRDDVQKLNFISSLVFEYVF